MPHATSSNVPQCACTVASIDEFLFRQFFVHIQIHNMHYVHAVRAIRIGWFTMFSYFRNGSTRKMLRTHTRVAFTHSANVLLRLPSVAERWLRQIVTYRRNAYALSAPTAARVLLFDETRTNDDNLPFSLRFAFFADPNLNRLFIRIYYFHTFAWNSLQCHRGCH